MLRKTETPKIDDASLLVLQSRSDERLQVVVGPGEAYEIVARTAERDVLIEGKFGCAVFFDIKPDHAEDFLQAIREEAEAVETLEPEALVFEAYRLRSDGTKFVVLEIFESRASVEKHHALPHYSKIRSQLEIWQASPRSHDSGYDVVSSTWRRRSSKARMASERPRKGKVPSKEAWCMATNSEKFT